ncbi:MAG: extracellular solute-binding protein [Streptococcaceae bacterium]|jgi:putative aldouronate transport system substrate-binding protein|nr:extracellular solute-binding protein [Streptococcaceae bacterium]
MNKKAFFTSLFAAAAMFTLAACSNKSDTGQKTDAESGTVTLKIAYKDDNSSNKAAVKYYKELSKVLKKSGNLNVKFEIVDLPSESYADKLALQISSGNIPDIIYFQGGDAQFAQQKVLEDLRPYVKDSKYLKDMMTEVNTRRLENYPYLLWIKPNRASVPVVKKRVLDQVADQASLMADPTSANYTALLKALIGKSDGTGNAASYGITTAGTVAELDNAFKMSFGLDKTWIQQDGKYVWSGVSDKEKDKLTFYKKLYDEGILDKEFLTKQWDTKEQAFYDGKSGMILGTTGKVIDMYNQKTQDLSGDTLVALDPAKGASQGYGATDLSKESRGLAISSQSKHKEVAFQVLDFLGSPEGQLLDRFGYKGEEYNIVDGKIDFTDKEANWYARFWEPRKLNVKYELAKPLMSAVAEDSLDKVDKFYTADNAFVIPDDLTTQWDAATNVFNEFEADVITGKKPISSFDAYIKSWQDAGGKAVTDYANKHLK